VRGSTLHCAAAVALAALLLGPVARGATDFSGLWQADPLRARRWSLPLPFTEEGRRRVEDYRRGRDPQRDDPASFCVPPGMPTAMTGIDESPIEIIQTRAQLTVLLELQAQQRRIYLDGRALPDQPVPSALGLSVGRWEGDTLVVETRALKEALYWALPRSDRMRIVERWRATDGGRAIVIDITVTDPVFYKAPLKALQVLQPAAPGTLMMEYDCGEGAWEDHLAERAAQRSP
jgi:hypothetical protein